MEWLRELSEYWRNDYDWRASERELNQLPQYPTSIDGQRIAPDRVVGVRTNGGPGGFPAVPLREHDSTSTIPVTVVIVDDVTSDATALVGRRTVLRAQTPASRQDDAGR